MRIVTENLNFIYGKKSKNLAVKALDGVSLTVEEGDFLGIVGETGSGKSTFIQHINGLIKVQKDSGKLTVGEFDLTDKKCDYKKLRSKVGMVFQYPEYQLFAETVKDEVEYGLKNFFPNLSENDREMRVKDALSKVGLIYEKIKDRSPFDMSGGQRRRIAIAGVIVSRPEILVLDEPVAGLDPKGKKDFIDLLKKIHGEFVKTVVIVSHDMDLVAENCNKVAVFNHGKVVAFGTPKQVFSSENQVKSFGLDLPLTAFVAEKLREKGIEAESDLTVSDFVDKIKEYYERARGERS